MADKHDIGKLISTLRKEKKWTQAELAEKLGVSDKAISKWESGNGFPEITQFPVMAQLFGVSIDYLMTGVKEEPVIVAMSKIEYCAKNDDVELFKSLNSELICNKDDTRHDLLDYIVKYDSIKVFNALLEKYSAETLFSMFGSVRVLKLLLKYEKFDKLTAMGQFSETNIRRYEVSRESIYYIDLIKYVVQHPTQKLLDKYLSIHKNDYCNPRKCWLEIYNKIFVEALAHKKLELLRYLVELFLNINKESLAQYLANGSWEKVFICFTNNHYINYRGEYAIININNEALIKMLDLGLIEQVESLYQFRHEIEKARNSSTKKTLQEINLEQKIQIAKAKKDKKVSQEQIKEMSFVYDGIIDIKQLLETNDIDYIRKLLYKYPISMQEQICMLLQKKDKKALFMCLIDHDLPIAEDLANCPSEEGKTWHDFDSKFCRSLNQMITKGESDARNREYFGTVYYGTWKMKKPYNLRNYLQVCQEIRDDIVNELVLQRNFEEVNSQFNKQYFEKALQEGNVVLVVTQLCVKLESYLKAKKHYTGEFSKMLDQFCSTFNTFDDEYHDYDPYTPKLLNKLRMFRNNLVHSDKKPVDMSIDELRACINYICSL